jgi:hypothetical protein
MGMSSGRSWWDTNSSFLGCFTPLPGIALCLLSEHLLGTENRQEEKRKLQFSLPVDLRVP